MKNEDDSLLIHATLCGIRGGTPAQVYEPLAQQSALGTGLRDSYILARLNEQERRATSGIGGGVAIPHLRLKRLAKPYALLARLAKPVDFNALDGAPVDLVLLLLSPDGNVAAHLQRLSRFSRLMRDPALCAGLREMPDADAMAALLMERQTLALPARRAAA